MQLFTGFLTANTQSPGGLKPEAVKLTAEGKTVRFALSITEEQLKQVQKEYEARQTRMAARTQGANVPKPRPADTGLVIQGSSRDMGTVHLPPSN